VAGLTCHVGKKVRYFNPQSIQQAVQFALRVQDAEKKKILIIAFTRYLKIRLVYILNPVANSKMKVKVRDI